MASWLWQAERLISASLAPSSVGKTHLSDYPVTSLNKSPAKSCPPMTSPLPQPLRGEALNFRLGGGLRAVNWMLPRAVLRAAPLRSRTGSRLQLLWLCVHWMPRSGDGGGFLLEISGNGITAVAAGYKGLPFSRLPGKCFPCFFLPLSQKLRLLLFSRKKWLA